MQGRLREPPPHENHPMSWGISLPSTAHSLFLGCPWYTAVAGRRTGAASCGRCSVYFSCPPRPPHGSTRHSSFIYFWATKELRQKTPCLVCGLVDSFVCFHGICVLPKGKSENRTLGEYWETKPCVPSRTCTRGGVLLLRDLLSEAPGAHAPASMCLGAAPASHMQQGSARGGGGLCAVLAGTFESPFPC